MDKLLCFCKIKYCPPIGKNELLLHQGWNSKTCSAKGNRLQSYEAFWHSRRKLYELLKFFKLPISIWQMLWTRKLMRSVATKKIRSEAPWIITGAWLPRSICKLSEVMKMFYLLIEVVAIQVYIFVQTDQIVYTKCVFILCKVHSSDPDINKWDSDPW